MDRKREFASQVNAIDQAHRVAFAELWPLRAALDQEVAALRRRLVAGDTTAVSEALDLLEIRKPVFGVGYAQEKLARSLKKATLDESALARVEFLVLKLIESELSGGQLRELTRVLVDRSTPAFRESLKKLRRHMNPVARYRAERVLAIVTNPGSRPTRNWSGRKAPCL
jgi:hypothetical protein